MSGWRLESVGRTEPDVGDTMAKAIESLDDQPDLEANPDNVATVRRKRRRNDRLAPLLILAAVILLFGLSAWYVYQRFTVSGSSEVPIIRADSAPVVRQPDDPGGLTIPNQDRVVLERGEVDETVLSGGTTAADGTVPISELPLNIDSSSDVAELPAGNDGQASDDQTVAEPTDVAADEASERPLTELEQQIAEQGGSVDGVPAGSVDVEELVTNAETQVAELPAVTDPPADGPTVLIERQDPETVVAEATDAVEETVQSAGDAVTEQVADAAEGAVAVADSAAEEAGDLVTEANNAINTAEETVSADAAVEVAEAAPAVIGQAEEAAETPTGDDGGARIVNLAEEADAAADQSANAAVEQLADEAAQATNQAGAEIAVAETPAPTATQQDAPRQIVTDQPEAQQAQAPEAEAPQTQVTVTEAPQEEAQSATVVTAPQTLFEPTAGGAFRVQVSSVQSEEAARQFWAVLRQDHPDLLSAFDLTIERATVSGDIYNRVQVGPLDQNGASGLCDALKSRGQDCILVRR